jgi:membrane protein
MVKERAMGFGKLRRWRDIALRAATQFRADQISIIASGVALRATLAIFPGIALLVWVTSRILSPDDVHSALQSFSTTLPESTRKIISRAMTRPLAASGDEARRWYAGAAGPVLGLLLAFWSTSSSVKALLVALNSIFQRSERRSFLRLLLITLAFTAGAILAAAFAIVLIVTGPQILILLGTSQGWLLTWRYLRWPVLFGVSAVALGILYRYAPNHNREPWPVITAGGLIAASALTVGSAAFSWFMQTFASLSITYGSLSTIIAFMIWMWLSFAVTLAGAELDAAIRHESDDRPTG